MAIHDILVGPGDLARIFNVHQRLKQYEARQLAAGIGALSFMNARRFAITWSQKRFGPVDLWVMSYVRHSYPIDSAARVALLESLKGSLG